MIPSAEQLAPLEAFDADRFAGWLTHGLADYRDSRRSRDAFAPVAAFVGQQEDVTLELKLIFDALSETARQRLRQGIAKAIADLSPALSSLPVMKGLLQLAGRFKATQAIAMILTQAGTGFFGRRDLDETRSLFGFALETVAGMAPGDGVAAGLRHLAATPAFESDYAPMVFIGLCRSEPSAFPAHMDYLRTHFHALHAASSRADSDPPGAQLTSRRFAHYVPLDIIAEQLYRLRFSLNREREPWVEDNWLLRALFLGDRAPLRLMGDSEGRQLGVGVQDEIWIGRSGTALAHGIQLVLPGQKADRAQRNLFQTLLRRIVAELRGKPAESATGRGAGIWEERGTDQIRFDLSEGRPSAWRAPRHEPAARESGGGS
jgi:hypothetical protein